MVKSHTLTSAEAGVTFVAPVSKDVCLVGDSKGKLFSTASAISTKLPSAITSLFYNANKKRLYAATSQGSVLLFTSLDLKDETLVSRTEAMTIQDVSYCAPNLAIASSEGQIRMLNIETTKQTSLDLEGGAFCAQCSQHYVAALSQNRSLALFNIETREMEHTVESVLDKDTCLMWLNALVSNAEDLTPARLSWDVDGCTVYVPYKGKHVLVARREQDEWSEESWSDIKFDHLYQVIASPNSVYLACVDKKRVAIVETATKKLKYEFAVQKLVTDLKWVPEYDAIVYADITGKVQMVQDFLPTGSLSSHILSDNARFTSNTQKEFVDDEAAEDDEDEEVVDLAEKKPAADGEYDDLANFEMPDIDEDKLVAEYEAQQAPQQEQAISSFQPGETPFDKNNCKFFTYTEQGFIRCKKSKHDQSIEVEYSDVDSGMRDRITDAFASITKGSLGAAGTVFVNENTEDEKITVFMRSKGNELWKYLLKPFQQVSALAVGKNFVAIAITTNSSFQSHAVHFITKHGVQRLVVPFAGPVVTMAANEDDSFGIVYSQNGLRFQAMNMLAERCLVDQQVILSNKTTLKWVGFYHGLFATQDSANIIRMFSVQQNMWVQLAALKATSYTNVKSYFVVSINNKYVRHFPVVGADYPNASEKMTFDFCTVELPFFVSKHAPKESEIAIHSLCASEAKLRSNTEQLDTIDKLVIPLLTDYMQDKLDFKAMDMAMLLHNLKSIQVAKKIAKTHRSSKLEQQLTAYEKQYFPNEQTHSNRTDPDSLRIILNSGLLQAKVVPQVVSMAPPVAPAPVEQPKKEQATPKPKEVEKKQPTPQKEESKPSSSPIAEKVVLPEDKAEGEMEADFEQMAADAGTDGDGELSPFNSPSRRKVRKQNPPKAAAAANSNQKTLFSSFKPNQAPAKTKADDILKDLDKKTAEVKIPTTTTSAAPKEETPSKKRKREEKENKKNDQHPNKKQKTDKDATAGSKDKKDKKKKDASNNTPGGMKQQTLFLKPGEGKEQMQAALKKKQQKTQDDDEEESEMNVDIVV